MITKYRKLLAPLVLTLLVLLLAGCGSSGSGEEVPEAPDKVQSQALALPYTLEEGRLVVENVFQYSGMNPDRNNEEGTEIAALEVRNASVLHLNRAELTLTVDGGEEIAFVVEDLPAGAAVMVFSRENQTMDEGSEREITCKADFSEASPLARERVTVETDGAEVTVSNVSGEAMKNVKVYCHSLLEDSCYGGRTYCYTIDQLDAGADATVEATDCYLDGALPVRIEG